MIKWTIKSTIVLSFKYKIDDVAKFKIWILMQVMFTCYKKATNLANHQVCCIELYLGKSKLVNKRFELIKVNTIIKFWNHISLKDALNRTSIKKE